MIGDYVKTVIHGVLSSDALEHCLVHSHFGRRHFLLRKLVDACYSMDEGHVDYVLALESWLCEKSLEAQLDVIVPVSIL